MTLAPGARLGPYEIQSPLGAGGMGEVYRGRDTRLERTVAVKILPSHLSEDAEAKQRFDREARTISSLSHPHICTLFDVGHHDGIDYLVMEYLEGETLADQLRKGPLPVERVLKHGVEICQGLERAHRSGIVHRDLKPGNIILTKIGAKLMDFGLAKPSVISPPASSSPTITLSTPGQAQPLTVRGTVVGTFQYMSPEQVEGKEADARSDIFSLGAVLYEMTTGKRAFEGKSAVSVAAAILEKEPEPIKTLQPMTPPALERAVKKCMAKDPDQRWQNAGDLGSELSWILEGGAHSGTIAAPALTGGRGYRELLAWILAVVALMAAVTIGGIHFSARESKLVVRSQINVPEKFRFNFVGDNSGPPVISPDGKLVVFSALVDGKSQLYLRSISKLSLDALPGTEGGTFPFWSPDSRSIAFFTGDKLKRLDVGSGPAVTVADAPQARGGTWSTSGIILFSPSFNSPLFQVPASGGTPVAVTHMDPKYTTQRWPWVLPDGKHFLYMAANHNDPSSPDTAVFFASLDGKENRFLVSSRSDAIYASGLLLYVRDNTLVAQPMNASTGRFQGDATVLNDDVQVDASLWRGTFAASENGTLLYQPGSAAAGLNLAWLDRNGKQEGSVSIPDDYRQIELSPDGKRVMVSMGEPLAALWVYDLARKTRTRLTFGNENYSHPVWSPDGSQIAYTQGGGAANDAGHKILSKASNGTGEEKLLLTLDPASGMQQALCDWSPDGRYLMFRSGVSGTGDGFDLWILPLFGDRKPFPYVTGPGDQLYAQFSPDGRWVAYTSSETGRNEVYVAPFPRTGAKWQVSQNGGTLPRWRRDGAELFFAGFSSGEFVAAQVNGRGANFEVGEIRELFIINNMSPSIASEQYDVSADGKRFLVITTGEAGTLPLTLVQNWRAELKR
jgi:eukaryotic-like serine/threonine-protein kinase